MRDNAGIVADFLSAWSRLDVDELVAYFCEDGTYHNIPARPVTGHAALRPFISAFAGGWASTTWDIVNLVAAGDIVVAERIDRTVGRNGKSVDLPCCGVFEMENGRIKVWRDYFDMATYANAMRDG